MYNVFSDLPHWKRRRNRNASRVLYDVYHIVEEKKMCKNIKNFRLQFVLRDSSLNSFIIKWLLRTTRDVIIF